jgi:hypothetical protein
MFRVFNEDRQVLAFGGENEETNAKLCRARKLRDKTDESPGRESMKGFMDLHRWRLYT